MESICPIRQTLRILGKRWTILIIKEIFYSKKKKLSFMELKKQLTNISTKVLSERLKEMVIEGLLKRKVQSELTPVRVYYSLTPKGKDACNIVDAFKNYGIRWGGKDTTNCSEIDCELCAEQRAQSS